MKKTYSVFACLLAGLLAFRLLVMLIVPVFDPSEARYAAISANMSRSGDFLVPRFTHEFVYQSFDGKPPLVFQAGGVFYRVLTAVFGERPCVQQFSVRIFPLLSALLVLAILYGTLKKLQDEETARCAAGMCATAVAFYAAAGFAMTDIPLTCCIAGALCLEACFAADPKRRYSLGVFALLGCGMLIKGPVAVALFGLPVFLDACINRRWRVIARHSWVLGPLVFLAIAAPWFVLMQRANPDFLVYFFWNENVLRFLVHDYGDKYGQGREAFRGAAALWACGAFMPWTLLAGWTLYRRGRPSVFTLKGHSLFATALVAITAFWCLTSRVPFAYLLPVVPLFAAWTAVNADRALVKRLLPYAGGGAAVLLGAALAAAWITGGSVPSLDPRYKQQMPGPVEKPSFRGNRYSYDFYRGALPEDFRREMLKAKTAGPADGKEPMKP